MLFIKYACVFLLLLPVASTENKINAGAVGDAVTESDTAESQRPFFEDTDPDADLPFPAESITPDGAMLNRRRGPGSYSSSMARRRRKSSRRRGSRRRRKGKGGGKKDRRRRRRKPKPEPTPAPSPSPPVEETTPEPTPNPHSPDNVIAPDDVEYVGVGGCADSNTKFYGGIIAAGTQPKTFTMYKPDGAKVPMTLQRCVDILSHLNKVELNGQKGIRGMRGLRYGACHIHGGEKFCACYILGDGGFQGQAQQHKVPDQPSWPQQCCNPPGYGCWGCDFNIIGDRGGGKGPIDNPGGGFAGVCYKLKKSFG